VTTPSLEPTPRPAQWADVPDRSWDDWQWQQANRLRTADELSRVLTLSADERAACERAAPLFPLAVTPYYAALCHPTDPTCPVRRQAVPSLAELETRADERDDPLAEDEAAHMPVPNLTHRYPDRALLYATHNCPVYCRHCNRKRKVGDPTTAAPKHELYDAIAYVAGNPQIRDVLVSGGDPLSFSDDRLEDLLSRLRAIPHLEIIRVATRNPVTLPQRITPALAAVLKKYHPIFVNTHFNHEKECTPEAALALERLADAGCVLGNQMVLLRGINEDPGMVKRMNLWLLRQRCRPYYIFQADVARGISHFRTPLESGVAIIDSLRGHTSGLAVPHYVVDLPGGGGKVSVQPDYLTERDGKKLTFRNYAGRTFTYEEG
jgi:lysine 2,3-aminomutase